MAAIKEKCSWKSTNLVLTVVWAIMLPVAYYTGWIYSIAFISLASIYANFASHLAAWRADDNPQMDKMEEILEEK